MMFTKTKFYLKHKKPIDRGRSIGGKRILGDNKTWIGFLSMIAISSITHVIWGGIIKWLGWSHKSDYYNTKKNKLTYNLFLGSLNGFIYMISELPNSFIKRRLNIESDKRSHGLKGIIFFIIDQIDSIIGIAVMIKKLGNTSWKRCGEYIYLGGFVHLGVNMILYKFHVRKSL